MGKIFHRLIEQMVLHKAKRYREILEAAESYQTEGDMQQNIRKMWWLRRGGRE